MAEDAGYGDASDQHLLASHVEGDPDAFGELVRRHRDRLWAVALRTLGDREEAADAVQDALVSAYRAAHTFRGQSAVTTWLHRITVNACLDRARKAASRKTSPVDDTERLEQLLEPHEEASAPAERNDLHRQLLEALGTLPPDQRAALVLVDMQGYPVAEAARVLDVPTGTVKSRCARGRARLLPLLKHLRPESASDGKYPDERRNRTQGTSVPPAAGPHATGRATDPRDTGPSDSAAVKGGGGRA
ncbi:MULTISPECIES: RNA polymerase sigma factor SigM [unclassified Streptomyces]|uniref:RNA polymerase sigma factor SigM n=1 Tax=unclassified Streptomyces TaxID=2593676 RepID=UPI0023658B98|nr:MULTISPECIES: RNA polymerase sigma factor SigM [unclassified Streptomyces]MDF3142000.1 RNA polymerase sigma factor SigM [Streptomyces sp. T21Q-yed]WDF39612.1 RNA polymerase sigma factor SigM [Streptomyces sp. T12]